MIVPMGHGPDAFSNALRHARRTYLLSQRALAARLGVPHSRISRLEGGHHGITLESAISLYRALGFSIGLVHTFVCPQRGQARRADVVGGAPRLGSVRPRGSLVVPGLPVASPAGRTAGWPHVRQR